jgi:8-oxo-dGTP diphosphatase
VSAGEAPRAEKRTVAVVVALRGGKILVARRAEGAHLGGLWEFPGGKVEPGEGASAAARRELAEETGLKAVEIEPLVTTSFNYPDRFLEIHAWLAADPKGDVRMDGDRQWAWVAPDELQNLEMPPANGPILRALIGVTSGPTTDG